MRDGVSFVKPCCVLFSALPHSDITIVIGWRLRLIVFAMTEALAFGKMVLYAESSWEREKNKTKQKAFCLTFEPGCIDLLLSCSQSPPEVKSAGNDDLFHGCSHCRRQVVWIDWPVWVWTYEPIYIMQTRAIRIANNVRDCHHTNELFITSGA